jgi:tripartite-type tricarboxylate transporter receptor subunit TctC
MRRPLQGLAAVAVIIATTITTAACAQDFPARPLRLIVGYAAGSGADVVGRIVADGLSDALRQPVVVENRPGGNVQIALNAVRMAEADGYTLLWGGAAPMAVQPLMDTKVSGLERNFNPVDEFSIVAFAGTTYSVLVTGPQGPKTLNDLALLMRTPGSNVSYVTLSAGSTFDMAQAYLVYLARGRATGVGYKGTGPARTDVMAGLVTMEMETLTSGVASLINEGKLHALAVLMKSRSPKLPNVPTMSEAGFPAMDEIDWDPWYGVFVKKGVSAGAIDKLNEATRRMLSDAKYVTRLDGAAFEVYPPTNAREAQSRWEKSFVSTRTLLEKLGLAPK